jgi:hypothetical protein
VRPAEYLAIVQADFLWHIDGLDLTMTRVTRCSHLSRDACVDIVACHVDGRNLALAGLPPERMRLPLCLWRGPAACRRHPALASRWCAWGVAPSGARG